MLAHSASHIAVYTTSSPKSFFNPQGCCRVLANSEEQERNPHKVGRRITAPSASLSVARSGLEPTPSPSYPAAFSPPSRFDQSQAPTTSSESALFGSSSWVVKAQHRWSRLCLLTATLPIS